MEFDIIKKLFILLFVIDVIGFILATAVGASINNPGNLSGFNSTSADLTSKANNMVLAITNYHPIAYQKLANVASNIIFDFSTIGNDAGSIINAFVWIGNFIAEILSFVINLLLLIVDGIVMIILLFAIVPAMFTVFKGYLGFLGDLFLSAYAIIVVLSVFYFLKLLMTLISGIRAVLP